MGLLGINPLTKKHLEKRKTDSLALYALIYLKMDMSRKRELQKQFIGYTQNLTQDDRLNELLDWEKEQEILNWLDSL
jgi:hypothetical protein